MRRRAWVGSVLAAVVLVGGYVTIRPPATLTVEQTDAFHDDLQQLVTIMSDSPASVAQWRRRCAGIVKPPRPVQRAAVADIVELVNRHPGHRLVVNAGQTRPTVRDVAIFKANDLAECRRRVPGTSSEWMVLERQIRAAATAG